MGNNFLTYVEHNYKGATDKNINNPNKNFFSLWRYYTVIIFIFSKPTKKLMLIY